MRGDPYGSHRVISPKGLLPQAAERVDNSPTICSNEILIDVIALQPTATAFGRIKQECGGDVNRIAQEIQKIVDERGKFQDPVTKSGGSGGGNASGSGGGTWFSLSADSTLHIG